jgi:hypothetical protein
MTRTRQSVPSDAPLFSESATQHVYQRFGFYDQQTSAQSEKHQFEVEVEECVRTNSTDPNCEVQTKTTFYKGLMPLGRNKPHTSHLIMVHKHGRTLGSIYHLEPCKRSKRVRDVANGQVVVDLDQQVVFYVTNLIIDNFFRMDDTMHQRWSDAMRTHHMAPATQPGALMMSPDDVSLKTLLSDTLALKQPCPVMPLRTLEGNAQQARRIITELYAGAHDVVQFQDDIVIVQSRSAWNSWPMRCLRCIGWISKQWNNLWV